MPEKSEARARSGRAVAQRHVMQATSRTGPEFRTWYRGETTNFNPKVAALLDADNIRDTILKGWAPERPLIGPDTQVTAFGSCFAANISNWLSQRNFRVLNKADSVKPAYVVSCGEGMVNSFVIRQQFEWAWEGKVFDQPLWHGYKAEEYGYDPEVQAETKRIFDATDVFILTFGLSEVWYDEPTGNVFWRTIPKSAYDPKRHRFRVSTVEENRENLEAIYQLIRTHRPDAKVIFTLSPIPLIATFRDNACLSSNSVSKAVLRVAIDETVRAHADEGALYYWPSYELLTDVFHLPYKADRRHFEWPSINFVMALFQHVWCETPGGPPPLAAAWAGALAVGKVLPPEMASAVLNRRPRRLRSALQAKSLSHDAEIDAGLRKLGRAVLDEWAAARAGSAALEEPAENTSDDALAGGAL